MMAPKQQLEKQAWQWAETTVPQNITRQHLEMAYRLNLKPCKPGTCRRNCKGNPHCLLFLGEGHWLGEIDERNWHDIEDPNDERRQEGCFVGLKNLGATCYLNTFLQVWFQNIEFRSAIYQWREHPPTNGLDAPAPGPEPLAPEPRANGGESSSQAAASPEKRPGERPAGDVMPDSISAQLQLIFAQLQFSKRRYVDPAALIKSLGLDVGQQQDAQEFSKLFISLLEDTLSQSTNPAVANIIQTQFMGIYDYVTRCSACAGTSRRPSQFYELELNIKGQKDLQGCIKEFLQEEHLEGDNQYMCGQCNSKQNATRSIGLRSLPPVLNMQLMRFVFERQTGHKKKLNTFIQFPETLDMSPYVEKPDGTVVYDLVAVLIHRGPSAYSGHYIAHIKDRKTDTWFKFNDEQIEKMGGKNLQLGNEEEIQGGAKKPRTPKGCHSSRNAYMLVYRQRTVNQPKEAYKEPELTVLPGRVQQYLDRDNCGFEDWVTEMLAMRDRNVETGKARQAEITDTYNMLSPKKGEPCEWVQTKWLISWLSSESKVNAIDNSDLLCSHNRLHPDQVTNAKYISQAAADVLFAKYGGKLRLNGDVLCMECVKERCWVIHSKNKLTEDSKLITALLKAKNNTFDTSNAFWVGKQSLRSWRRLVMNKLESQSQPSNGAVGATDSKPGQEVESAGVTDSAAGTTADAMEDGILTTAKSEESEPGTSNDLTEKSTASDTCDVSQSSKSAEPDLVFNSEILCGEHGDLSTEAGCRRLVPTDIWLRLKAYFPDAPEFSVSAEECQLCKMQDEEEQKTKEQHKLSAVEQKSALQDLYLDKHRPQWSKEISQLYIVSQELLEDWRKFIKDPLRRNPVTETDNKTLLCPHGGFLYEPSTIGIEEASERLVYVWPQEWEKLQKYIRVDVEVCITRIEEDSGHVTFLVQPEQCDECNDDRVSCEIMSRLNYDKAVIFVRKVASDKNVGESVSGLVNSSAIDGMVQEKNDSKDPEFIQENGKRKKLTPAAVQPEKVAKVDSGQIRRSSRHRRQRGEKEVTVSSVDTLRDLKLKIMKLFSVAPFDQHLTLEGQDLQGDMESLAALNVFPGSVLYLKADEPVEDPTFLDDVTKASCPEEGFKGTGLLGR